MATPLHVLILEDRPADAALMVHELRRAGFDPVWRRVETEEDYLAHLDPGLDVILADYTLPQFDALRALQLLQERGGDTPFLIVSATIGEEIAVAAMQQGAADYLLKDRLARLGPAVLRALQEVAERRARQQAETALRVSEVRFRTMAEAAPILLWMAGTDMGYTYFNQQWLEFTGRTMEQELGYGWVDNVHPDDSGACLDLYTTAFVARQPFEMEYRLRRADGVYRWVLDRGVPLVTPEGHFSGYIGSAIDITTRKEAEHILQQTQAELERRVQERTAALEHAMAERQRLEQEAQRAQHFAMLGRLAAGISHEIRNPLGAIFLHFDLLQEVLRELSCRRAQTRLPRRSLRSRRTWGAWMTSCRITCRWYEWHRSSAPQGRWGQRCRPGPGSGSNTPRLVRSHCGWRAWSASGSWPFTRACYVAPYSI